MTSPPRIAQRLLAWLGAPDAFLGDLHECHGRHGRRWYWRQVGAFVVVSGRRVLTERPVRALWWLTATVVVGVSLAHAASLRAQPNSAAALRAEIESTGWMPAHEEDGRLEVVPAVRVRVWNTTGEPIAAVQVMAVFRRAVDGIEWGNDWRPLRRRALLPGAPSEFVTAKSAHGVVGRSTVDDVLRHPSFVDARVEVFARHGAQSWAKIAEQPVSRRLTEP